MKKLKHLNFLSITGGNNDTVDKPKIIVKDNKISLDCPGEYKFIVKDNLFSKETTFICTLPPTTEQSIQDEKKTSTTSQEQSKLTVS